jgi:hypothetical protein
VDAGTGAVSGQTVTFSFPLGVDEVKTVRLWVKLPQASGQVTLQAVVQAGQGNQTVSVPAEVVLPLSQVDDLEALQARLEAWVGAGHPEAKALGKASHFVGKALSSADRAGAIREVLQAADVLVGRSHPDVVDLRVALGTWLRWASLDTN